ncbi:MAG: TetR/AcrR family transcriptional regulator [Planctomycetes bacterium]|nr:TetR/AcrR family transcriptional regulator [Planctomycetota bacterium]
MPRPTRFKHAIYESATKLFSERGVSGTGIREIARQAGVSEAALYRHWKGKQQLAREIFVQGMADLHTALVTEVPTAGPVSLSVLATVRIFFEAFDENPEVFHYVLLSEHELWRTIDADVPNPVSFWFDLLRGRVGEFDLPPELSNELLGPITLGMILRPSIAAAYGSVAQPLASHATTVSHAICRVIGVPWTAPADTAG